MFDAPDFPPPNTPPRAVWPWWVAGGAVLVIVALVAVWFFTRPGSENAPTIPPDASAPSTSTPPTTEAPTDVPDADPAPTGCLGGPELTADAFALAQERATHSANGAVDVVTAVTRFMFQTPYPSSSDQQAFQEQAIASTSSMDTLAYWASEPEIGADVAPPGTELRISTVGGAWYLDSYTDERAIVTVAFNWVADGAVVSSIAAAVTFEVTWESEGWRLVAIQAPEHDGADVIASLGTPFTGGC